MGWRVSVHPALWKGVLVSDRFAYLSDLRDLRVKVAKLEADHAVMSKVVVMLTMESELLRPKEKAPPVSAGEPVQLELDFKARPVNYPDKNPADGWCQECGLIDFGHNPCRCLG